MSDNTVELDGVQFPADDVLAVAEKLPDNPRHHVAEHGKVQIRGDVYYDEEVRVVNKETDRRTFSLPISSVVEKAEEAATPSFEEVVKEKMFVSGLDEIDHNPTYAGEADLEIVTQLLPSSTLQSFDASYDIGIRYIEHDGAGFFKLGLEDLRDE